MMCITPRSDKDFYLIMNYLNYAFSPVAGSVLTTDATSVSTQTKKAEGIGLQRRQVVRFEVNA